ncbi:MAG: hypothetical protein MUE87_01260 [Methanothrix sp.]|jgi:hypothetical protein|nr:hypothetical protein [Methanothrix sp.]
MILVLALALLTSQATGTYFVNETIGDYRISFESKSETDTIMKAWDLTAPGGILGNLSDEFPWEIKDVLAVLTGSFKNDSDVWSGVLIFILDRPTNVMELEEDLLNDSSVEYKKISNRTIDGQRGFHFLESNTQKDPDLAHIGLYWLDEDENETATELVFIISGEGEAVAERVINTTHVEKLA